MTTNGCPRCEAIANGRIGYFGSDSLLCARCIQERAEPTPPDSADEIGFDAMIHRWQESNPHWRDGEGLEDLLRQASKATVERIVTGIIQEVWVEADASAAAWGGDFASMHEAYGFLADKFENLFEAVRMGAKELRPKAYGTMSRADCIRQEAIHVAAIAMRIAEQSHRVNR